MVFCRGAVFQGEGGGLLGGGVHLGIAEIICTAVQNLAMAGFFPGLTKTEAFSVLIFFVKGQSDMVL